MTLPFDIRLAWADAKVSFGGRRSTDANSSPVCQIGFVFGKRGVVPEGKSRSVVNTIIDNSAP